MNGRTLERGYFLTVVVGVALVIGAATTVQAQRRVFEWSGRVDHDLEITVMGNAFVTTRIGSNERLPRGSSTLINLPRTDGELSLKVVEGRGEVEVAQQPASENGYTAVIRLRDPENGGAPYRIDAFWQPAAAGEVAYAAPFERPASEVARDAAREAAAEAAREREARNRVALMWIGDVDSELEIVIQPSGISYNTVRGSEPRAISSAISRVPPGATLLLNQIQGRGETSIIQQPTAENGYTAKLRVRDSQQGFGHYVFMVAWQ